MTGIKSTARDTLKRIVGAAAEFAYPELGREIDEARNIGRAVRLKRAIHHARLCRAQAKGDAGSIERSLADFWRGEQGVTFHNQTIEWRFELFVKHHAAIIDALHDLPTSAGAHLDRLVEIGCGDGKALAYCVERLPWVGEAIGLDINADVIARNRAQGGFDPRISFVTADAREWLMEHLAQGTVVFTNGGVLEYFSQSSLDQLLETLAGSRPAGIALVEPVAPEHDLIREPESLLFGHERSFSHNHRRRLEHAGFEVVFEREMQIAKTRWMLMAGIVR